MNAYLEETVAKYLHPSDDYISLTEIARRFDAENPSYLIQSWLRGRNTVEFLAAWERNNNPKFNEAAFQKLVVDAKTPQFTLTPKKVDRPDECHRHYLKTGQGRWYNGTPVYCVRL